MRSKKRRRGEFIDARVLSEIDKSGYIDRFMARSRRGSSLQGLVIPV
jgi:hypothetical protein